MKTSICAFRREFGEICLGIDHCFILLIVSPCGGCEKWVHLLLDIMNLEYAVEQWQYENIFITIISKQSVCSICASV